MAGLEIGGILTKVLSSVSGFGLTIIFIILAVLFIYGGLIIRKRRKLNKPVIELYDIGNGIFDFKMTTGGWFKQHLTFMKLWDYGKESVFRLKDGTPIYDLSHNDYRRINNVNGVVIIRNPHDPKFAIPISKFWLTGLETVITVDNKRVIRPTKNGAAQALAQIAPVDLRNAAVSSIEEVGTEMKTSMEKWMPIIALGTIAMVLVLITIFNTQYGKHMVDVSAQILKDTKDAVLGLANNANTLPSTAP